MVATIRPPRLALVSCARSPERPPTLQGGRPLDPEQPETAPEQSAAEPGQGPAGERSRARARGSASDSEPPPGLRAQFQTVKAAALDFVRAHVNLARAELDEIKGEVARASGLALVAVIAVVFAVFLVVLASFLFFGDLIYGSMGWGILLGTELLLAVAITAVLVALRIPGLGRQVAIALLPGIAVALVLGFNLPNHLFAWIGETLNLPIDAAYRPLAVGIVLVGLICGIVTGIIVGRSGNGATGAIGGFVAGLALGGLFGAFLSITFGWQPAAGLGTAVFLAAWPILMGLQVRRQGIDTEALAARFYPKTTIETTKESIEWAKARMPGPKA